MCLSLQSIDKENEKYDNMWKSVYDPHPRSLCYRFVYLCIEYQLLTNARYNSSIHVLNGCTLSYGHFGGAVGRIGYKGLAARL